MNRPTDFYEITTTRKKLRFRFNRGIRIRAYVKVKRRDPKNYCRSKKTDDF